MTGIDISVFIVVSTVTFILGFIVAHKRFTNSLGSLNDIKKQFTQWYAKLDVVKDELSKANKEIEKLNVDIEVDGGVTLDNVEELLTAGANVIVAGTAVFKGDVEQNVKDFLTRMQG